MIDRLGRNITYLRISVTDKCNLRCRYCMPEDGVCKKEHNDMMTEDEIITAVEAAAALGITKIRITGGEPLVKRNIVSICRRAAGYPFAQGDGPHRDGNVAHREWLSRPLHRGRGGV